MINRLLTGLMVALAFVVIAAIAGCGGPETETPIRSSNNNFVTVTTDFGNMTLELYRDVAPAHADSFLARTNEGFYDGLHFFRIIKGFMMQGGDPQNLGIGGPGYTLDEEFSDLKHVEGTLSMARSRDPNSAGSQFFVCFGPVPQLDNQYTVFGQLVNGYETLRKIQEVKVEMSQGGEMAKPVDPVIMTKVYQSDAAGNPI